MEATAILLVPPAPPLPQHKNLQRCFKKILGTIELKDKFLSVQNVFEIHA